MILKDMKTLKAKKGSALEVRIKTNSIGLKIPLILKFAEKSFRVFSLFRIKALSFSGSSVGLQ